MVHNVRNGYCTHIELWGLTCVRCGDFMRHCRRIYVTNDKECLGLLFFRGILYLLSASFIRKMCWGKEVIDSAPEGHELIKVQPSGVFWVDVPKACNHHFENCRVFFANTS